MIRRKSSDPHRAWSRPILIGVFVSLILKMVTPAFSQSVDKNSEKDEVLLRGAFVASILPEMNIADARAAVKVWAETAAARKGIPAVADMDIFQDVGEFKQAFSAGAQDLIAMRVEDFIPMNREGLVDPLYIGLHNGKTTEQFVILVHRTSGIADFASLQGRKIMLLDGPRAGMADIWLDTLLLEARLPERKAFFAEVKKGPKVSRTVLPVFFRQSDACLTTLSGFETMVQLNPQVGKDLVPLVTSPELLPGLLCVRRGQIAQIKKEILDALLDLHSDPKGQQVCMLFGVERLARYTESDLQGARALMDKYLKLVKRK